MPEKDNEVFLRKPLLNRTPKRSKNENQTSPTNSMQTIEKNTAKRDLAHLTLADLFILIESKHEEHSQKLDDLSINIGNDITNFKAEINQKLDGSLQNVNKKIDMVEKKTDLSLQMAIESQKLCVNYMKQARLDCCMDISGLKFNDDNLDLKTLAFNTIRSFKININETDIKKVTTFDIKKTNSLTNKILTVKFDDVDTKLRVLREKNKIKANNGVFFNATLTPSNGYYMRKAKYLTKGSKIKPKFYDGAVHVKIPNGNIMLIQSEDNLEELKKLIDEQPAIVTESNPQPMDVLDE